MEFMSFLWFCTNNYDDGFYNRIHRFIHVYCRSIDAHLSFYEMTKVTPAERKKLWAGFGFIIFSILFGEFMNRVEVL